MDIAALSMAQSQMNLSTQISTAVLTMSLDSIETAGESTIAMMEQSVTPGVGANVDIKL